jgi:O-acetyl-ADP-ribose deacetylase (regulator of RNase III)
MKQGWVGDETGLDRKGRQWKCVPGFRSVPPKLVNQRFVVQFVGTMNRLIIVSPDKDFADTARWRFRTHPKVEVVFDRFENLQHFDCVVTPGNSFGLMDAGMDRAVLKFFGPHIQTRIQQAILSDYLGEQPVGTSILVETGMPEHPFLAHSPTMRVPANISRTDNAYLALWATLTSIYRHNRTGGLPIQTLACPGLGTGTGGLDPLEASLQLLLAYEHYLNPPEFLTGTFAQARHERIHYGANWGFENPRKHEL